DRTAVAAMIPGGTPTTGGISVLGLAPRQNGVTLNNMSFAGGQIPRDVAARLRVSTASYDPAIGWFSGARSNIQLGPAEVFTSATTHLTVDAPSLQATDPVSARLGQRVTNFNASAGAVGQLPNDKYGFNYGVQGGRRSADVTSL